MRPTDRRYLFMDVPTILIQSINVCFQFVFSETKAIVTGLILHKRKRRRLLLYLVLVGCALYILSILTVGPRYTFTNSDIYSECIIPDLNPWDESIIKFDWHPDPIVCDPTPLVVFIDHNGRLQLNKSTINRYDFKELKCTYSEVYREMNNDDLVNLKTEKLLSDPVYIGSDFVRVKCSDSKSSFKFDQILLHASTVNKEKEVLPETNTQPSLFIFGLDAVSRLAAIRKLPLTYKYLKDELKALEFMGHMKTGDNTFPNFISILTGKEPFSSELPPLSEPFDAYPFIWNDFSQVSYATYYSEDSPEMHTFNLGKPGFRRQPTDHYMRPFWRALKKTDLVSTLLDDAFIGLEANKINVRKKSSLCYYNTPKHLLTVQYYKDFIQKYTNKRRFAFSWLNDLSHNYVNFLELGDKDFKEFLMWISNNRHLDNAFLFFLSDHGSRIDVIRNTYVGRVEERMPLLLIVPPKSFRQQFPKAFKKLQENTKKLTSHYDIYKTLVDIRNKINPSRKTIHSKGISLFSEIPLHRSCADAGIPEQFCSCYTAQPISIIFPVIQELSKFVVDQINLLLAPEGDQCAVLTIQQIKDAQEISLGLKPTGGVEFFSIWKYFQEPEKEKEVRYLILILTSPGDGLFEAVVKMEFGGQVSLLGPPIRTNMYGNQSACITDHIRRTFCYCTKK